LYSLSNSSFDIYVAVVFGFAGYIFRKLACEPAPLLLGFVLGPMIEENLRRALLLSDGDWTTFVSTPLSAGLLLAALMLVLLSALPQMMKGRGVAAPSDQQRQ
jgi:TctA family transporter